MYNSDCCRFIALFVLMFIQTDVCSLFLCFAAVLALKWADCPTSPVTLHHCVNSETEQSICGTSSCTTTQTQTRICNVVDVRHTYNALEPILTVFEITTQQNAGNYVMCRLRKIILVSLVLSCLQKLLTCSIRIKPTLTSKFLFALFTIYDNVFWQVIKNTKITGRK